MRVSESVYFVSERERECVCVCILVVFVSMFLCVCILCDRSVSFSVCVRTHACLLHASPLPSACAPANHKSALHKGAKIASDAAVAVAAAHVGTHSAGVCPLGTGHPYLGTASPSPPLRTTHNAPGHREGTPLQSS